MIESRVDPRGMGSRGRSPEYGKGRLYTDNFGSVVKSYRDDAISYAPTYNHSCIIF